MKGYMQTLEAIIAIGIALLAVTMILTPQTLQERRDLSEAYFNCIDSMENRGLLRYYAENDMEVEIYNDLDACLPGLVNLSVKICSDSDCISSMSEDNVQSYNYFVAGYDDPDPKLIKVWLWT